MAAIVVAEFSSLDGVMEAPGGEDFKYPGWSFEFDRGEDGNQFKLDEALASEALLIGRVTPRPRPPRPRRPGTDR
jgi:hypothetical protein